MRTIKDIIKDMEDVKSILGREIETVPFSQRPAWQGALIQAKERLPKLVGEVKQIVVPNGLIGLFATGDEESIAKVAALLTENEGIVLDAEKMYLGIVERIEPSYSFERMFCSTQYHLMVQCITEIGQELGYLEIEAPKFAEKICPTFTDTLNHVRNMLRECRVGDQANVELMEKEVVDTIVKNEIESKQIPVMVINTSCTEEKNRIATLFAKSTEFEFPPNFTPTAKNITALFKGQKPETQENE